MNINIPDYVNSALLALENAGHQGFIVGGCVRDALMGKKPADWDVCTSAKPEQIKDAFSGYKTIDIGMKHGTVAVLTSGGSVEITTYRIDGEYLDNRHPQTVVFTDDLTEDLARRDFTMNAIAYHPKDGLRDPFDGQKAIANRLIRCVGEPVKRFEEDSLRILRGLRFASVLGFQIEKGSAEAMRQCAERIRKVSAERINVELSKLILGSSADKVLQEFGDIIKIAAPGLRAVSVCHAPKKLPVRLAMLFPEKTEAALRQLKYDNHTIKTAAVVAGLLREAPPEGGFAVKKLLYRHGEEISRMYFETLGRLPELEEILQSGQCYSVGQLAVNGRDLIAAGIEPGKAIGESLEYLLQAVMKGKVENDKEQLLQIVLKEAFSLPQKY